MVAGDTTGKNGGHHVSPPFLPYEIIAKGIGKLYCLHIPPETLSLELVGQIGNAVAPAVILRKPVNDFLHRSRNARCTT